MFHRPSTFQIIKKSPVPWPAKVKLSRLLAQGWELDLFSTFLSRSAKGYEHRLVGPFRLFRLRRQLDTALPLSGGMVPRMRIEFFDKEV